MLAFLCQSEEQLGRSFNGYYSRGHAYTCAHTCAWLWDSAVKTEETFQYFLFAEPKIPASDQPLERGMQQHEGSWELEARLSHKEKTNNSPNLRSFSSENIFTANIDQQEIVPKNTLMLSEVGTRCSDTGSQLCQGTLNVNTVGREEESHQH